MMILSSYYNLCSICICLTLKLYPATSFIGQLRLRKNLVSTREIDFALITTGTDLTQHVSFLNKKNLLLEINPEETEQNDPPSKIQTLKKIKRFSFSLLTGLLSVIFSSRKVNAATEQLIQTSNEDYTNSVSSKLSITGGAISKKKIIKSELPKSKPTKKKGLTIAIISGAIAGTAFGLGLKYELQKKEGDVDEREESYNAIVEVEPPTKDDPDQTIITKQADKIITNKVEKQIEANEAEVTTVNSVPEPLTLNLITSYIDTSAHLNSLVNSNSFKAEQARKAENEHKRKLAAEKAALEKLAAEKVEVEAKMNELQMDIDSKVHSEKTIATPLVQPLSPQDDQILTEKYAKLPLEERAFQILLDLGLVAITPDPDDPDYDPTFDDELAPENVYL